MTNMPNTETMRVLAQQQDERLAFLKAIEEWKAKYFEADRRSDQLHDALQGLKDWCEEGCPEGGRYALVEAAAALKNIRSVTNGVLDGK